MGRRSFKSIFLLSFLSMNNFQKYEMFVCFVCGRAFDEELAMREHINEDHFDRQVSAVNFIFLGKC